MESRRKTARLSLTDIPEILKKPIILYNYEEVGFQIENISPLGIGLTVDKNSGISTGDFFYLKFFGYESDIKCLCVYSDEDDNGKSIGAYFTEPEDKIWIAKQLHFQNEN